jgi:hypothetical protein
MDGYGVVVGALGHKLVAAGNLDQLKSVFRAWYCARVCSMADQNIRLRHFRLKNFGQIPLAFRPAGGLAAIRKSVPLCVVSKIPYSAAKVAETITVPHPN